MPYDVFRPHWRHKGCGGIVAGVDNDNYQCGQCGETQPAIGAVIPPLVENRKEYLNTHPELEVVLLSGEQAAAAAHNGTPTGDGVMNRFRFWRARASGGLNRQ